MTAEAAGPGLAPRLTAPELLAHLFLSAGRQDAQDAAECWDRFRSVWQQVTGQLGLDRAIEPLGAPRSLPAAPPVARTGLLAAAERDAARIWQAAAWAQHDALCLTVMMAPPRDADCGTAWRALERSWSAARPAIPPEALLGEARVFLALAQDGPGTPPARPGTPPARPGPAAALVRAAAPPPSGGGWWQHWDTIPLGAAGEALIWEPGPDADDTRACRRLITVVPVNAERPADRLLWTSGGGRPAPLTQHLLQAARLRHQVRVFDDGRAATRRGNDLRLLVRDLAADNGDGNQLTARLAYARGMALALAGVLGEMRHVVTVLGGNLRLVLNPPDGAPSTGPLGDDQDLAGWLGQRIDDEIAGLDAATAAATRLLAAHGPVRDRTATPRQSGGQPSRAAARGGGGERWAVILTAIPDEFEAIRECLTDVASGGRGSPYLEGTLPGMTGRWRVATVMTGHGSPAAAAELTKAAAVFGPEIALFVGVAGGRKDVAMGDVVAADVVYDCEPGRATKDRNEPRIRTHFPAYSLFQQAQKVASDRRWQQRIRPGGPARRPECFIKPIVTVSKVIAHNRSEAARVVSEYAGDAVAVEMEGFGFLEGVRRNPGIDALVIRGVSDLLTGKTRRRDEYWQPVASRAAAAFAMELLSVASAVRG